MLLLLLNLTTLVDTCRRTISLFKHYTGWHYILKDFRMSLTILPVGGVSSNSLGVRRNPSRIHWLSGYVFVSCFDRRLTMVRNKWMYVYCECFSTAVLNFGLWAHRKIRLPHLFPKSCSSFLTPNSQKLFAKSNKHQCCEKVYISVRS